jgi:ribosomal 50S subunit-associated protein YjgA (DUF615 family)
LGGLSSQSAEMSYGQLYELQRQLTALEPGQLDKIPAQVLEQAVTDAKAAAQETLRDWGYPLGQRQE